MTGTSAPAPMMADVPVALPDPVSVVAAVPPIVTGAVVPAPTVSDSSPAIDAVFSVASGVALEYTLPCDAGGLPR